MDKTSAYCDNPNENSTPHFTIDRLEGAYAVLENSHTLETMAVLQKDLPRGAAPGHSLEYINHHWQINWHHTHARHARINTLFEKIKAKNTGK